MKAARLLAAESVGLGRCLGIGLVLFCLNGALGLGVRTLGLAFGI